MKRIRGLGGLVVLGMLFPISAVGAGKSVGIDVRYGNHVLQNATSTANSESLFALLPRLRTTEMYFQDSSITNRLIGRFGLGVRIYDLEKYLVRDKSGKEAPLSRLESSKFATQGSALLQQTWSLVSVGAEWRGSVGKDLFDSQRLRLFSDVQVYSTATKISGGALHVRQNRPATTFLDRDFVSKDRPTVVNNQEAFAGVEQLVLEGTKVAWNARYRLKNDERPSFLSNELQMAQALYDGRVVVRGKMGLLSESRLDELQNERGYFEVFHAGPSLIIEPILGNFLELSYLFQNEKETDPRVDENRSIHSETYGLGFWLEGFRWKALTGLNLVKTETQEYAFSMQGGLQWDLE